MKRFSVLFLLLCVTFVGFAQKKTTAEPPVMPVDEQTKLITYQKVIPEEGTATVLYDRAMQWAKDFYKNTAEVIKSADREAGVIEFRSSVRIYSHQKDGSKLTKNVVYYNFKLQCRDGRYRYTITDFNEKAAAACPIEKWMNPEDKKWDLECYLNLEEVNEQIEALLESLTKGMHPKAVIEDEW